MNTTTHGLPPRAGLSQIAMTTTDFSSNPAAQVLVPDALPFPDAASRVTHLGVGAHHDDLEFMAFHGIVECMDRTDRWFGGVTCTDGRGSSRSGVFAEMSPEELGRVRAKEQNEAAVIGQYGVMFQLGYPSSAVTNPADTRLREDLTRILKSTRPRSSTATARRTSTGRTWVFSHRSSTRSALCLSRSAQSISSAARFGGIWTGCRTRRKSAWM